MRHTHTRRRFLSLGSLVLSSAAWPAASAAPPRPDPAAAGVPPAFPAHPPALVREVVGVAHGNLARLREIVDARPALARAAWDWGFGDWEDALGAASHTGHREIAAYLIERGARPTVFSATMLGQLDVVKAFVAAQPGIQRIPGPHSIGLLAHARAGGAQAEAVRAYLEALGDADAPPTVPLTADDLASVTGTYAFGPGPGGRIDVSSRETFVMLTRHGASGRPLRHLGHRVFHPAGAADVRITFAAGATMTIADHDLDRHGAAAVTATSAKCRRP